MVCDGCVAHIKVNDLFDRAYRSKFLGRPRFDRMVLRMLRCRLLDVPDEVFPGIRDIRVDIWAAVIEDDEDFLSGYTGWIMHTHELLKTWAAEHKVVLV